MTRVAVPAKMFRWAIGRAGTTERDLRSRFAMLESWISGRKQPTLKQLESFAKATYTPIGFFFLSDPPEEPMPIPDFRTVAGKSIAQPSPNLLDTIYLCQQRQDWYRDYMKAAGGEKIAFIGSAAIQDDIISTAGHIREALGLSLGEREQLRTWADALRHFIEKADDLGIMVMVSGVVGSNNTRKLDVEEFRGFALSDEFAPLVFINGSDTKSAQMFTLAHELAHLWLGQSALSDATVRDIPNGGLEQWCNQVAAELLVPIDSLRTALQRDEPLPDAVNRLSRKFKVSTLVILRRLYDARRLSREQFWSAYDDEFKRLREIILTQARGGGNYYLATAARVSRRFAHAVIAATFEGRTTFTEAFRLLGCRKTSTLQELGREVGVPV